MKEKCWVKADFASSHVSFTLHEKKKCHCTSTQHVIINIFLVVSDVVAENQNLQFLVAMRHLVITLFISSSTLKKKATKKLQRHPLKHCILEVMLRQTDYDGGGKKKRLILV